MRWLARQGDSSGILFSTIFKIKLRFSYIMTVHKWADIIIFRVISPPTGVTRSSPLCLFFYAPQAFVWHLNPGSLVHSLNLSRNARLVLFTVSPINEHKKRNHITSPNFRCHNLSVYWPPILVVIVIVISLLRKFRFCGLNKGGKIVEFSKASEEEGLEDIFSCT